MSASHGAHWALGTLERSTRERQIRDLECEIAATPCCKAALAPGRDINKTSGHDGHKTPQGPGHNSQWTID